jgi:hypothetical protein
MENSIDDKIDELELAMQDYEPVNCPLTHTFTNGLYSRIIFMPKGALITSLKHKTEHQFAVLAGSALVKIKEGQWERISAPYNGITKPGTRRILYIEEDCVWGTWHRTDIQPENESHEAVLKAVQLIEDEIIEPHENALLGGTVKNNIITKTLENELQ